MGLPHYYSQTGLFDPSLECLIHADCRHSLPFVAGRCLHEVPWSRHRCHFALDPILFIWAFLLPLIALLLMALLIAALWLFKRRQSTAKKPQSKNWARETLQQRVGRLRNYFQAVQQQRRRSSENQQTPRSQSLPRTTLSHQEHYIVANRRHYDIPPPHFEQQSAAAAEQRFAEVSGQEPSADVTPPTARKMSEESEEEEVHWSEEEIQEVRIVMAPDP